jgi:prepilin peptidase CpaA
MGGGDVKLLVAIGALLQTLMGVEAQMYTFFGATLVAPARLAYEGKLLTTLKNTVVLGTNMFLPKEKRRPIDEAALSSFRIGPAVLFGVLLTAWRNW